MSLADLNRWFASHPLTKDRRLGAFARFARWQIQSRLADEIVFPWIEGTKLLARRGMTGATGNIYAGLHEFHEMAFVLHLLRPDDLFVDGGANIGSYTILASGVLGARTIAFEPDPEAAHMLRRNVALNGIEPLVDIRECALSDHEGESHLTVGFDTTNRIAETGARVIRATTMDVALRQRIPTLVKLDLEGHEPQAINGARDLVAASALKAIIVEDQSAATIGPIIGAGFKQYSYDPFERRLGAARPGQNALFVRDANEVTSRIRTASAFTILGRSI